VLAYGITENCQFGAKTDRNSVFLGRDPPCCESVIYNGPIFQFLWFLKKITFQLDIQRCSLWFYLKLPVWGKNWSKLRISWSWPPYCESVIYNGLVFQFLRVLKNFTFLLKIHGCAYGFTENWQFGAKTDRNSVFLGRDPRITNGLSITVPYFNFYGFWKNSHFCSKCKGVSLWLYRNMPVWGQKLIETPYFLIVTPPVLWIGYL
jgi:hypothetical protein